MPNNFIKFGIDLLPNVDEGFALGSSSLKWNIFGNLTGNVTGTATSWTNAQNTYVNLESSGTDSTLNGGQNTAQVLKVNGVLPISNGGTGLNSYAQYDILYASAANTLATLTKGTTAGTPLITGASSAAPSWYNGLILTGTASNDYNASFSGTVNITGATIIGANGTASTLTVWGATTLNSTLEVTSTSTLTGSVGIGASPDNNFKLYVNGDSKFNGNLIPTLSTDVTPVPNKTLGSNTNRWAKVYIGTADTYGDVYTPIYWNDGVPVEVDVVKVYTFSFANGGTSVVITPTNTNKAKSIVTEIVVDTGISYLNGAISWEIPTSDTDTNKDKIVLTTAATSGVVSGYILVSIGT